MAYASLVEALPLYFHGNHINYVLLGTGEEWDTLHSSFDTYMLEIQQYKRKTHGFHTFSCFGPHI